jgi:hypothetical protein
MLGVEGRRLFRLGGMLCSWHLEVLQPVAFRIVSDNSSGASIEGWGRYLCRYQTGPAGSGYLTFEVYCMYVCTVHHIPHGMYCAIVR